MRRSLFVGLIGLIFSSDAIAQTDPQPAPGLACGLRQPAAPRLIGFGKIIGFETDANARAEISVREARLGGSIDPRYLDDLRAIVQQDNGQVQTFDVPRGMTVHVGDRVMLHGSYRSKDYPCSYIPILVTTEMPVS